MHDKLIKKTFKKVKEEDSGKGTFLDGKNHFERLLFLCLWQKPEVYYSD